MKASYKQELRTIFHEDCYFAGTHPAQLRSGVQRCCYLAPGPQQKLGRLHYRLALPFPGKGTQCIDLGMAHAKPDRIRNFLFGYHFFCTRLGIR